MAVAPEASRVALASAASATAEQLFQEHSGWIYGYCLRVLRSPEEAEDALQTTYLNACRSLNRGTRPLVGSAWLLRIAQNVCFARLRSSGRRQRLERAQDIAILEETVAAPERPPDDLIGLTEALCRMPDRQREAILLREWQGLSYRELGHQLGLSQAAVETLIFRARRSLAAALEGSAARSRRKALHALDLGGLLAAIKGFLAGSAGVKAAAVLTAAVATTTTVVTVDPVDVWDHRPEPVGPRTTAPAPEPVRPAALVSPPPRAPYAVPRATEPRPTAMPSKEQRPTPERLRGGDPATPAPAESADEQGGAGGQDAKKTEKAPGHTDKPASPPAGSRGRTPPAHGKPDKPDKPAPASSEERTPPAHGNPDEPTPPPEQIPPAFAPAKGQAEKADASAGQTEKV
jgi:RNA polymerase sigma-70 factor (ECF subfamily)